MMLPRVLIKRKYSIGNIISCQGLCETRMLPPQKTTSMFIIHENTTNRTIDNSHGWPNHWKQAYG